MRCTTGSIDSPPTLCGHPFLRLRQSSHAGSLRDGATTSLDDISDGVLSTGNYSDSSAPMASDKSNVSMKSIVLLHCSTYSLSLAIVLSIGCLS